MSTVSSSLSAGLQTLSNAGLLPSNLTTQQLQNASPAELTANVVANVELTTISTLFGTAATPSDSVSLSDSTTAALFGNPTASSSGTPDPILQALDSALTASSNAAANTAASGLSTTTSPSNTAPSDTGSMFSYMG